MNLQPDGLAMRVTHLEQRLRRQQRMTLALGILLLVLLGVGVVAPTSRRVEASSFVLVNDEGRPLAELGFRDHIPGLRFLDGVGDPMSEFKASEVTFWDYGPPRREILRLDTSGIYAAGRRTDPIRQPPQF